MPDEITIKALDSLSYGIYIVSSCSRNGKFNGQLVNTVFQVTAEPPRLAVSVHKNNLTHGYISESGVFSVSVLEEQVPMTFLGLFGFKSGKDTNKFKDIAFRKGTTGCPIVTGYALFTLEARVVKSVDIGTHTLFIGEIAGAEFIKEGTPLTYSVYREKKRGKTPKNAATYKPESPREEAAGERKQPMKKYVCKVCGYVYDPAIGDPEHNIAPGTPFEKLPADWVCPVCGAGKEDFEPEA